MTDLRGLSESTPARLLHLWFRYLPDLQPMLDRWLFGNQCRQREFELLFDR